LSGMAATIPQIVFSSLTSGGIHTCGLGAGGVAYCWGHDSTYELGDNDSAASPVPVPVAGGFTFASVSAGGGTGDGSSHTCGIAASGATYCWGNNKNGQLGNGSVANSLTPTLVSVPSGVEFGFIGAGITHTCGLSTPAGIVYCWGDNSLGQVGDGTGGDGTTANDRSTPQRVAVNPPSLTFRSLSVGGAHTCALTANGTAYCWGWNDVGQLGDGTMNSLSSVPESVLTTVKFSSISGGQYHTCGLELNTDLAFCWGWNANGQLGINSTGNAVTPQAVITGTTGMTFSSISAGLFHTCAIALTPSGMAYCWGLGGDELGIGNNLSSDVLAPEQPVAGGLRFSTLMAGGHHTCGLTASGAYCWGINPWGELGIGTFGGASVPAKVLYQP
ncbi:MAG TPA: hypothetical protein VI653_05375, partial [Steroidobacteraceae bacterium]